MLKISQLILLVVALVNPLLAQAQTDNPVPLLVADPFLEMHTGPGAGYPVFYVVDRGQKIIVLKRKTRWYKIRTESGKTGWSSRQKMLKTLLPSGQQLRFSEDDQQAFVKRVWEIGATTGELEKASTLSVYGAYSFTPNLSSEFTLGHSTGNVSSSQLYKMNLLMQPFPEWDYSPFFTLGAGVIQVKPNATLVDPADKNNSLSQIGFGFKTYLSRRFVLRFEMNEYVIFSASNEKDKNEDISEWKIGFAVFF